MEQTDEPYRQSREARPIWSRPMTTCLVLTEKAQLGAEVLHLFEQIEHGTAGDTREVSSRVEAVQVT